MKKQEAAVMITNKRRCEGDRKTKALNTKYIT